MQVLMKTCVYLCVYTGGQRSKMAPIRSLVLGKVPQYALNSAYVIFKASMGLKLPCVSSLGSWKACFYAYSMCKVAPLPQTAFLCCHSDHPNLSAAISSI